MRDGQGKGEKRLYEWESNRFKRESVVWFIPSPVFGKDTLNADSRHQSRESKDLTMMMSLQCLSFYTTADNRGETRRERETRQGIFFPFERNE